MSLRIGTFKDENKVSYGVLYDSTTNYVWPIAFDRDGDKTAKKFLKWFDEEHPTMDPRDFTPNGLYELYERWLRT